MKPAAKIMLGLGAAAATALWATRGRHQAAIRGTTLLMAGASRPIDWRTVREWIERGARVVVYARSAGDIESALRELRRLGPAATVQVRQAGESEEPAVTTTASSGVRSVLGTVAALSSVARWIWPALTQSPRPGEANRPRRKFDAERGYAEPFEEPAS